MSALPKMMRGECPVGECGRYAYAPPCVYRDGRQPVCGEHGEPYLPRKAGAPKVSLEWCSLLCPDALESHPDWEGWGKVERGAANPRGKLGAYEPGVGGESCADCGRPRALHLDPDLWYCRPPYGCGSVNERHADGSLGAFRAAPFSAVVEKCNGLAGSPGRGWSGKVAAPVDDGCLIPF